MGTSTVYTRLSSQNSPPFFYRLPSPPALVRRMSQYTHCSSRSLSIISLYSSLSLPSSIEYCLLSVSQKSSLSYLHCYSFIALFQSLIIWLGNHLATHIPHQTLSSLRRERQFSSFLNCASFLPQQYCWTQCFVWFVE